MGKSDANLRPTATHHSMPSLLELPDSAPSVRLPMYEPSAGFGRAAATLSLKKRPVTDRETELPILLRQDIPFSPSEPLRAASAAGRSDVGRTQSWAHTLLKACANYQHPIRTSGGSPTHQATAGTVFGRRKCRGETWFPHSRRHGGLSLDRPGHRSQKSVPPARVRTR